MTSAVIKKTNIHCFQKNIVKCGHVTTECCKQQMSLEGALPSEVQNWIISTFWGVCCNFKESLSDAL